MTKLLSREEFMQAYDNFVEHHGSPPDHAIVVMTTETNPEATSHYWFPAKAVAKDEFEVMIASAIDSLDSVDKGGPEHVG